MFFFWSVSKLITNVMEAQDCEQAFHLRGELRSEDSFEETTSG